MLLSPRSQMLPHPRILQCDTTFVLESRSKPEADVPNDEGSELAFS